VFTVLLSIAPIFLLIVLGHLLRRGGIPSFEFWNLNNKLVYWVLFPSLLFYKMATMDMEATAVSEVALIAYCGFAATTGLAVK
jgi:malonate transporter and related proteins